VRPAGHPDSRGSARMGLAVQLPPHHCCSERNGLSAAGALRSFSAMHCIHCPDAGEGVVRKSKCAHDDQCSCLSNAWNV